MKCVFVCVCACVSVCASMAMCVCVRAYMYHCAPVYCVRVCCVQCLLFTFSAVSVECKYYVTLLLLCVEEHWALNFIIHCSVLVANGL